MPAGTAERQASGAVVVLIAAMDERGVIGRGGSLPWHLPDDLQQFRSLTLGKPILMGRHTYESIGRPLPGRRNIVLSRAHGYAAPGVEVVHSLEEARRLADAPRADDAMHEEAAGHGAAELCVIGGAQIYALALGGAQRLHLTRVHACVDGDVYFPACDFSEWRLTACREHDADARHVHAMSFMTFERRVATAGLLQA